MEYQASAGRFNVLFLNVIRISKNHVVVVVVDSSIVFCVFLFTIFLMLDQVYDFLKRFSFFFMNCSFNHRNYRESIQKISNIQIFFLPFIFFFSAFSFNISFFLELIFLFFLSYFDDSTQAHTHFFLSYSNITVQRRDFNLADAMHEKNIT